MNTWTVVGAYTLPPAGPNTLGGVTVPSNSGLSVSNTGVLSANIGMGPGTVAAGNDPRIASALQPTSLIPAANILGLAPSATKDATNASNITGGVLAPSLFPAMIPASTTGNAATASALAAMPAGCSAGQFSQGISATGTSRCAQVSYSQLTGVPAFYNQAIQVAGTPQPQAVNLNFAAGPNVTITPSNNGVTTTLTLSASTGVSGVNGNGPITSSGGSSPVISCSTCATSATPFTNYALILGQGSQALAALASTGSTNQVLHGNASGLPSWGGVNLASDTIGTLAASGFPALAGDTVTGAGSLTTTTSRVNGTTVPANSASDQALITSAPASGSWASLPSCPDAGGSHLNYSTASHTFSCGSTASSGGSGVGGSGSVNALPLFTASTTLGNSSLLQNNTTGSIIASKDFLCNSQRPCVDVVALGADPTGATPSDAAFAAAHNFFNGLNGGTITMCGTFTLTTPWLITNPGLLIIANCGTAGTPEYGPQTQRGGAVIQSSTNSNIPAQTVGPILSTSTTGGNLPASTTYYIETTLANGFGETTPSPSVSIVTGNSTSTSTVNVRYPQYQSGGFAYNIYCSTDNVNFYKVPTADFVNGSGALFGPPFIVGPTPWQIKICPSSGTPPPSTNTASHGNTLVQIGTSAISTVAGPTFRDIAFRDSAAGGTLAGGVVLVQANRTRIDHCTFDNFVLNGNPVSGNAPYEQGGVALAFLNEGTLNSSSNYNDVKDTEFDNNTLSFLQTASDTTVEGGDFAQFNGQISIDYVGGNIRLWGTHFGTDGGPAIVSVRGTNAAAISGGIFSAKIEGMGNMSGPGFKLQYAHNQIIHLQCGGPNSNAAAACVTLDSNSGSNMLQIDNLGPQAAFSDGTTVGVDPSNSNLISAVGSSPAVILGKQVHLNQSASGGNGDVAGTATCSSSTATVMFSKAYVSTPVIIVSDETTAGGARVSSKSPSSFTVACSGSTDVFDYATYGNPN